MIHAHEYVIVNSGWKFYCLDIILMNTTQNPYSVQLCTIIEYTFKTILFSCFSNLAILSNSETWL